MSADYLLKLQKELIQHIIGPLQKLSKINLSKPDKLEDFEKLIKELPAGETFSTAFNEWVRKVQDAIQVELEKRKSGFGRIFSEFIRLQKDANITTREFSSSWRIGPLEIELRPQYAQVRCRYNQQVLTKWTPITNVEDLKALYSVTCEDLRKSEIPLLVFREALWEAYGYLKNRQDGSMFNRQSVPAVEMIKELKVVLYRKALERKAPRLKDTSDWVFLYNIDVYFSQLRAVPTEKRLSLEAGSQLEIAKGKGIILNGLDAAQDYKIYCYFKA